MRIDDDNLGDINYYIKSDADEYFEREEIEYFIIQKSFSKK